VLLLLTAAFFSTLIQQQKHGKQNRSCIAFSLAGCQWLTPVILATHEAEIRSIVVWSQPRQIVQETLFRKILHKKRLVEWLKVQALSSNPVPQKKKNLAYHPWETMGLFHVRHSEHCIITALLSQTNFC
jgi:hypothetical protein